ncbi:uncharacterized protein [Henckelia pumila]|uniref:uncharacterized protein n=1 Tax=Henckelia pumila TaxID=405737 RepID=UPI003C6DFA5D
MRDDDVPGPKLRSQWTADENTTAIYNAKALNAMDAWEKLQTHCEGSPSVKKTRMRLITSKFEKMRMEESETIMEYNGRLKSLANEASVLGDPISNERLVSKVLRLVPKRFHTKEVKESDLEENSIALISKKFTDYLKVMKEKKDVKGAQPSKFPKLPTSEKPQKHAATRGSRQRECKGYDHYAYEYANRLRKVFVKEGNDSLNHPSTASKGKKPIVKKNVSVPKPKQWKCPFVLPPVLPNTKSNTGRKRPTVKKVWIQKPDVRCLKDHLTDYVEQNGGRVTYGGGAKERIVGKGTLNVEGFPKLHNVLHVEGLNANLISISQLCDDDLHVKFDKNTCEVFDNTNCCVITGTRSVDNCYQLGEELACRHSKVDEFSLWHKKLGHVNFKTLKNLSKFEAVRGLSNLKSGVPYVCGACQKDLKGKTAENDIEGLLEIPHEEHSVVPDVAAPNTTLVSPETVHEENSQNIEEAEMITERTFQARYRRIIHHHILLEMFMEQGKPVLRTKLTTARWLG